MSNASARAAIDTCISPGNDASHMSVATGWLVMPASVTGDTKRCADAVMIGRTVAPDLMQRRATSTALYAAMLPVMARAIVLPSRVLIGPNSRLVAPVELQGTKPTLANFALISL